MSEAQFFPDVAVEGTWVGSGSMVGAGVRVTPYNLSNS
jgi:hypothetical protein